MAFVLQRWEIIARELRELGLTDHEIWAVRRAYEKTLERWKKGGKGGISPDNRIWGLALAAVVASRAGKDPGFAELVRKSGVVRAVEELLEFDSKLPENLRNNLRTVLLIYLRRIDPLIYPPKRLEEEELDKLVELGRVAAEQSPSSDRMLELVKEQGVSTSLGHGLYSLMVSGNILATLQYLHPEDAREILIRAGGFSPEEVEEMVGGIGVEGAVEEIKRLVRKYYP